MEVQIRTWRLSDAADLARTIGNPAVLQNLRDGIPYPYTEKDARDFIQEMMNADPDRTFAFAIAVEERVVGSIGVYRQGNVHRLTAELGYYIAQPFWGQGIGTQAVRKVCDYVFEHSDIIRIFAEPYAYNDASCRVLEKAGFQLEGILRKNAVKNSRILDMKMYAITR